MKTNKLVRNIGAVVLAGLLVVMGAWYELFWRSESSHLKAEKQAEAQAVSNVASLQNQLAALVALQKRIPAERAALAKLRQGVPDGPSLDQLLVTIVDAARRAGVVVTSIGTPEPSGWGSSPTAGATTAGTGSGPQSMTIPIAVTASSSQVLGFITTLDAEPRLYVVDQFSLSSPAEGSGASARSTTTLGVEAFYVSAAGNDPASEFPLWPAAVRAAVASQGDVGATSYDLAAKADAVDAAAGERNYFASHRMFVDARSREGSRALDMKLPWSRSGALGAGQVVAETGRFVGGRWHEAGVGQTGGAAVVESLSRSGTCFYVALYAKGTTPIEAYAETTGGCSPTIASPVPARQGTASLSKAGPAAAGVAAGAWHGSW
jgi:hypothetical protein